MKNMTLKQKIKQAIVAQAYCDNDESAPEITVENIDDLYAKLDDEYELCDIRYEFRKGTVETKIPCESSRHYESKSVAAKMEDGSWVGWTYWFGGGKHGEPGAIDWMHEAYDLDVTEEEKLVTVQTFSKTVA